MRHKKENIIARHTIREKIIGSDIKGCDNLRNNKDITFKNLYNNTKTVSTPLFLK